MKRTILLTAAAVVFGAVSALAIEPQYVGPLGNPETPALRPYKAMWRGMKAFVHQTKRGFVEGNQRFPVVGSVEVLRGMRRGAIELGISTYTGMAGSRQPDYRAVSEFNVYIDEEPFLCRFTTGLTGISTAATFGAAAEEAVTTGLAAVLLQEATDRELPNALPGWEDPRLAFPPRARAADVAPCLFTRDEKRARQEELRRKEMARQGVIVLPPETETVIVRPEPMMIIDVPPPSAPREEASAPVVAAPEVVTVPLPRIDLPPAPVRVE